MRRTKGRRQGGLGLVEMMVATTIVVVVLVGTVAAILSAAKLSQETARMHAATRAMNSVVENIRALDPTDILSTYGGRNVAFSEVGITSVQGALQVAVEKLDTGSTEADLYEVTIAVSYDGSTFDEARTMVTQITGRTDGTPLGATVDHVAQAVQ